MATEQYSHATGDVEQVLLDFLRAFEQIQNNMRPGRLGEFQEQLARETSNDFDGAIARFSESVPSEAMRQYHDRLVAGGRHCANARAAFIGASEQNYSIASMDIRRSLCRGLHLLYDLRQHTPVLGDYWVLPHSTARMDALNSQRTDTEPPVGVIHRRRAAPFADYSLYVPEGYTPSREWPLIVCLHGAGGRGDQFIWSWLRPARSHGYMVLAPKSLDVTWSILRPGLDAGSVAAMLEEVDGEYALDRGRVYLTGLSDGGTFTYLLGLSRSHLFAGIAPVAADFTGMMDDLLRLRRGNDLPIHIVHGAQDHIFPVAQVRSGHALLNRLGYTATYQELPEWGHSYCSFVNEQLVMPWFNRLGNAC